MENKYLIIYNDNKIIYAGMEETLREMSIKPGYHFEICANAAAFNKRVDYIIKEIMYRTPDPNPDYKRLYNLADEIRDISERLSNNYFHVLNHGEEDVELIKKELEESAQQIRDTIDDFCLLEI